MLVLLTCLQVEFRITKFICSSTDNVLLVSACTTSVWWLFAFTSSVWWLFATRLNRWLFATSSADVHNCDDVIVADIALLSSESSNLSTSSLTILRICAVVGIENRSLSTSSSFGAIEIGFCRSTARLNTRWSCSVVAGTCDCVSGRW